MVEPPTEMSGDSPSPAGPAAEIETGRSEPVDSLVRAVARAAPLSPGPAEGDLIGGNFRVERKLGAGGMGVVYLARDLRLERQVALKLHGDRHGDGEARIEREARALARLVHPNVVTVHEVGSWQGRTYIAMEYLDAGTLRAWLAARRHPWRGIVAIFLQAARGLAAAHDAGLVHRDFKPDNVLLGGGGRVRVADFGLARPVSSIAPPGEGTPGYMAPEAAHGDEVDARADQYAFCVALREALAGRDAPRAIDRILERGLHPDPAGRHLSLAALIEAIERVLHQRQRRRWWRTAALLAAVAAVAAGTVPSKGVALSGDPSVDPWADADPALRASGAGRGVAPPGLPAVATASSKYDSTGYGPGLAIDGDDRTAWCSGRKATPDAFDLGLERRFDDYVELRFPAPRSIGLIHMRSGLASDDPAAETSPRTIRDFAWAVQRAGSPAWRVVPGADLHANRQQLVLRVRDDAPGAHALAGVAALRLYIRRDRWRWARGGDSTVCLREVALADRDDAHLSLPPWFLTVETDDDAGIERASMSLPIAAVTGSLVSALGGSHADHSQRIWLGELYPSARLVEQLADPAASCGRSGARRLQTETGTIDDCALDAIDGFPAWVLHEPAPAAILLSGNTRHYHDREWRLALGLRALLRQVVLGTPHIPVLGEGGGQQLLAMSLVHDLPAFAHEFTLEPVAPDGPDRARIYHVCNRLFGTDRAPEEVCGEYSNLPRRASAPPYWMARSGGRGDVLFRFLEPRFPVWQGHVGTLDPSRLASAGFDVIASYADRDPSLPPLPTRPATAQAIRLPGTAIYGTLFAWADHAIDRPCEARDPANTTTELVLRNFLMLAMNVADPWRGARLRTSHGSAAPLADGDDATTWCGGDDGWIELELREAAAIARLLWRRGGDPASRAPAAWTIEARGDGGAWAAVAYTSAPAAPVIAGIDCPTGRAPALDADLELATLATPVRTDALRIRTRGACVRELAVLPALR